MKCKKTVLNYHFIFTGFRYIEYILAEKNGCDKSGKEIKTAGMDCIKSLIQASKRRQDILNIGLE